MYKTPGDVRSNSHSLCAQFDHWRLIRTATSPDYQLAVRLSLSFALPKQNSLAIHTSISMLWRSLITLLLSLTRWCIKSRLIISKQPTLGSASHWFLTSAPSSIMGFQKCCSLPARNTSSPPNVAILNQNRSCNNTRFIDAHRRCSKEKEDGKSRAGGQWTVPWECSHCTWRCFRRIEERYTQDFLVCIHIRQPGIFWRLSGKHVNVAKHCHGFHGPGRVPKKLDIESV